MKRICLIVIIDILAIITVDIVKMQELAVVRYDELNKLYCYSYSLQKIVSIYNIFTYNLKVFLNWYESKWSKHVIAHLKINTLTDSKKHI